MVGELRKKYNNGPRKEWARLYTDKSDESSDAEKLLREARFCVITFPMDGTMGPELKLRRHMYYGLDEITTMIEGYKD